MLFSKSLSFIAVLLITPLIIISCTDTNLDSNSEELPAELSAAQSTPHSDLSMSANASSQHGALTANGWYEEEEIYYIHNGIEEGVTERGENDIYLIGGDRLYQANVVEFIPGESGYSPHWNVYVVHTANGTTLQDILDSGYASDHFDSEGVLFDDVNDLRAAKNAGLVTFDRPGIVVNCPIVSEKAADAPGNTALSENFPPFPDTF